MIPDYNLTARFRPQHFPDSANKNPFHIKGFLFYFRVNVLF
jgi:hypothetical protein